MKQEQIDKLNKGIRNIVEEFNCDWLTAMESIALAAQLTKAKVSDEGDACGECVRDSEANISQPEYPDDPAIS